MRLLKNTEQTNAYQVLLVDECRRKLMQNTILENKNHAMEHGEQTKYSVSFLFTTTSYTPLLAAVLHLVNLTVVSRTHLHWVSNLLEIVVSNRFYLFLFCSNIPILSIERKLLFDQQYRLKFTMQWLNASLLTRDRERSFRVLRLFFILWIGIRFPHKLCV